MTNRREKEMREIQTDTQVLVNAISDAINVLMRDVLIPRGIVSQEVWHGEASMELMRLKDEIAKQVAERWRVSWRK